MDFKDSHIKQKKRALCYFTPYLKVLGKPVKQNVITAHAIQREAVIRPLVLLCLKIS